MNASPTAPQPKATRKDAVGNRERILSVAREAFAQSGATASMTSIAERASVGVGTLYRHFPTREALILELCDDQIGRLIELAPALLEHVRPLDALRLWFDEVARYGRLKHGIAEVIHAATDGGLGEAHHEKPFLAAIAVLLDACAEDGALKAGLDPHDVLLQLSVLWRIDPARGGEVQAGRILTLIIDGLRAR